MKTYTELTPEQQATAREKCLTGILGDIIDGSLSFNDALNGDALQARIDAAKSKADKMQTPWFAHEYILDTCRADLESMASATAEDALYSENEHVIEGVA